MLFVDRMTDFLRRPGLVVGVGIVGLLGVVAPEIFTGTFSDLETFLRVLMVAAIVALWVIGIRRFVDHQVARSVLVWLPIVAVVATFVWPYVRPATEVDEAFPPVPAVVTETPTTTTPPTTTTTTPITLRPTATRHC